MGVNYRSNCRKSKPRSNGLLEKNSEGRSLTVKKWISRIQNINALLTHMSEDSIVLTKKQIMNEIIISNIPLQYLREFRLYSNDIDSLRKLSRKLSDIIPENDDRNRRYNGRRGNDRVRRDTPTNTPIDHPSEYGRGKKPPIRSDQSNKPFKNECEIHKNHEWTDCKTDLANSNNRQNNDRRRNRRQEYQHHRRRQPSKSPSS